MSADLILSFGERAAKMARRGSREIAARIAWQGAKPGDPSSRSQIHTPTAPPRAGAEALVYRSSPCREPLSRELVGLLRSSRLCVRVGGGPKQDPSPLAGPNTRDRAFVKYGPLVCGVRRGHSLLPAPLLSGCFRPIPTTHGRLSHRRTGRRPIMRSRDATTRLDELIDAKGVDFPKPPSSAAPRRFGLRNSCRSSYSVRN